MLCYDRIGVSGGFDIHEKIESNECIICHYLDKVFKFQRAVLIGCKWNI